MKNNLSIFNNLRPITVGFDDMFDHFEHMMDDGFFRNGTVSNFPPYNIVKTGKYSYNVELALAGFNKKDIEVTYEDNLLTVKSKKEEIIQSLKFTKGLKYFLGGFIESQKEIVNFFAFVGVVAECVAYELAIN